MELSKKTTILLTPDLHQRLTRLADLRGTSLGQLVRDACREQYGLRPVEDGLDAVKELEELALPVGPPDEMEEESVPSADELPP